LIVWGQGSAEEKLTDLVLHALTSEHSKRAYSKGLALFFAWLKTRLPQSFSKALVQEYREWLLAQHLAPSTVNLRLSPLRKLAAEMADNGMLAPATAATIGKAEGVKQEGIRAGNWLLREQANDLLNAPSAKTLKGKRDRATLALLIGCGLRRAELLQLDVGQIQQREGRWVTPDLVGKGKRRRTVPVPAAVKARVDEWLWAAGIKEGKLFRPVNKGGRITGASIADEKAVWQLVLKYARATQLGKLSPHDLRRVREIMPQGGRGYRADSDAARPRFDPDHRTLPRHRAKPGLRSQRRHGSRTRMRLDNSIIAGPGRIRIGSNVGSGSNSANSFAPNVSGSNGHINVSPPEIPFKKTVDSNLAPHNQCP
jgi:integrase